MRSRGAVVWPASCEVNKSECPALISEGRKEGQGGRISLLEALLDGAVQLFNEVEDGWVKLLRGKTTGASTKTPT